MTLAEMECPKKKNVKPLKGQLTLKQLLERTNNIGKQKIKTEENKRETEPNTKIPKNRSKQMLEGSKMKQEIIIEPKLNSENGPNNEIIDKQVNCAPQVNKIGQGFNSNILKRKRNETNSVTEQQGSQKYHSAGYQLKNKKQRSVKVTSSHVGNVRVTPNEEGEGGQTELVVKPVDGQNSLAVMKRIKDHHHLGLKYS